jgi:hypothetical protein
MIDFYFVIIKISYGKKLTQNIFLYFRDHGLVGIFVHIIWVINVPYLVVLLINKIKWFNFITNMMESQNVTP